MKLKYNSKLLQKKNNHSSNVDVVVVGAGAAGLSATSELIRKGRSVLCIEAMDRIGGRCFTDHSIFGSACDIGAHWLHNYSGNQIAQYGQKNNERFNIYEIKEDILVYDGQKKVSPDNLLETLSNIKSIKEKLLVSKVNLNDNKKSHREDIPFINQIPNKLKENIWFETAHQALGACLAGVDFDEYTIFDERLNYESIGENDGFVEEGYGTLLVDFRKEVQVNLNTEVNEIKWNGKGVVLETNQGTIKAKSCIVTVSTEILRLGKIKFIPSLPIEKYEAFDGITLGAYNHITLKLKKQFYDDFKIQPDTYFFSKIEKTNISPKGYFGSLRLHKSNLSYFDVGGKFAKDLEEEGQEASIDFVLNSLRATFGSKFDQYLIKAHVTNWGKNKYTMGSYSSARPGKAHLRSVLKKPVGGRIFFAGEATSKNYGTVHGADLSGKEAANDLIGIINN